MIPSRFFGSRTSGVRGSNSATHRQIPGRQAALRKFGFQRTGGGGAERRPSKPGAPGGADRGDMGRPGGLYESTFRVLRHFDGFQEMNPRFSVERL